MSKSDIRISKKKIPKGFKPSEAYYDKDKMAIVFEKEKNESKRISK